MVPGFLIKIFDLSLWSSVFSLYCGARFSYQKHYCFNLGPILWGQVCLLTSFVCYCGATFSYWNDWRIGVELGFLIECIHVLLWSFWNLWCPIVELRFLIEIIDFLVWGKIFLLKLLIIYCGARFSHQNHWSPIVDRGVLIEIIDLLFWS